MRRPRLIAPKWKAIKNIHTGDLEIIRWNHDPITPTLLKIKTLQKTWKPPFPQPKIIKK
tara:strand:- start:2319 stop:2495 length:177 start_codon:yes stop_codon:yes gene_type:complete